MAPSVEGAGVALNVVEHGSGAPVLLIHGLAADAEAMEPVAQALAGEARVIAYDRRGYGSSGAPEPYRGTTVEEQAQDAAAVLEALDADAAVVCGDDFGALVALDLAKRHRALARAAVLCNPPLFMFVPEATERLAAQHAEMEAAVREGGPAAGVEAWLGGRVDGPALERARTAYQAFFADYAGLASWPVTRRELRALALPSVVLTGPRSPAHVVAAADALAGLMPAARRADDGDLAAAARTLLASP
ncbi:MAG TPA: alpha/beta fold hydrolase [Solirubrobacteraceae bacterium]|nr:alpha/beta fold hydrolase [Solirubrobacteraceae bacterium]